MNRSSSIASYRYLGLLLGVMVTAGLAAGVCLQEDTFISFRYARNLVQGHGLVFNPGEPVEGYTNFLWTVILAAPIALGADPVPVARFLGMAVGLVLVVVVYLAARRRDRRSGTTGGLLAASLVALSPVLVAEAVQGLETVFFALLVTGAVLVTIAAREREMAGRPGARGRFLTAGGLFCLAAMTRPEGVGVLGLVVLTGLWWRIRTGRRWPSRGEVSVVALFGALYLPYWIWRFSYYGYPFPNTFYCKTGGGGAQVLRGLDYVFTFLWQNPVWTLLAIWAVVVTWRRHRSPTGPSGRDGGKSALLTTGAPVVLGYLLYVIVVGGDFKSTARFIIPVMPLWALLLDAVVSQWGWPGRQPSPGSASRAAVWIVLAVIGANALFSLPSTAHWIRRRAWDLTRRTAAGLHLAEVAPPGAVLAIHSAGIIPYYCRLRTIDMWGLNDEHIAHRPVPPVGAGWPAGHQKGDQAYVFAQEPTFFVDEWYYVVGECIEDLRDRVFIDLAALGVHGDFRQRCVPLSLDDGNGENRYWFNYLQRVGTESPSPR